AIGLSHRRHPLPRPALPHAQPPLRPPLRSCPALLPTRQPIPLYVIRQVLPPRSRHPRPKTSPRRPPLAAMSTCLTSTFLSKTLRSPDSPWRSLTSTASSPGMSG